MKYEIKINQQVLYSTKLDVIDASILDYLLFACASVNEKIKAKRIKDEQGDWTWINYSYLIKSMPLLRINNKTSIGHRIRKLFEEGYIEYMRTKERNVYVRRTKKADELEEIIYEQVEKDSQKGVSGNLQGCQQGLTYGVSGNLQGCQQGLTYKDNNNKDIIPAKERKQNIGNLIPLIDQELTPEQIYKVSILKHVRCPDVIKKYYAIRDIIEAGDFKPQWGKDLFLILCKWIARDINGKRLEVMDEMQAELNKWDDPVKTETGQNLFKRFEKARKEKRI